MGRLDDCLGPCRLLQTLLLCACGLFLQFYEACNCECSIRGTHSLQSRLFSSLPLLQLRAGDQEANIVRRRFLLFPFHSGGQIGAGEDGEQGLRWLLYIYPSNICSLDPGRARRLEAGLRWWNKCLRLLRLAGESFGASDEPVWCEFLGSGARDLVGSFCPSFVFVSGVELGRLVYQHEVRLGWCLVPTYFGGSVPLLGASSSGDLGFLAVLEASESSLSGDVMVNGHLLQPGHSASTNHVGSDVLLKTATKNYVSSPGRKSASSCVLLLQVARKTGRSLQGLEYNFFFFRGCLCKERAVITKIYE
jgi:hypothetical protein